MVKIEIEIGRPWLALGLLTVVMAGSMSIGSGIAAVGGLGMRAQVIVNDAEEEIREQRIRQQVLDRREEILRYELEQLTLLHAASEGSAEEPAIWEARQELVRLLQDEREAEQRILESLEQIWSAQGGAALASVGASGVVEMVWPVPPDEGLSAIFGDLAYRKRFGLEHRAIDIPSPQGSTIVAAADGVVIAVNDSPGTGYDSTAVRHVNGVVSLYGHVSRFLAREGDRVRAGDPIAEVGGLPHTPGAGWLTTGPHLHFEVLVDGQQVDPLKFLPDVPTIHRE